MSELMKGLGDIERSGQLRKEEANNHTDKLEVGKEGWKYQMKVSFLEIDNETIRDFLRDNKNFNRYEFCL